MGFGKSYANTKGGDLLLLEEKEINPNIVKQWFLPSR